MTLPLKQKSCSQTNKLYINISINSHIVVKLGAQRSTRSHCIHGYTSGLITSWQLTRLSQSPSLMSIPVTSRRPLTSQWQLETSWKCTKHPVREVFTSTHTRGNRPHITLNTTGRSRNFKTEGRGRIHGVWVLLWCPLTHTLWSCS